MFVAPKFPTMRIYLFNLPLKIFHNISNTIMGIQYKRKLCKTVIFFDNKLLEI